MTLEGKAFNVAYDLHKGQVRKYTGDPYILHPIAVAATVKQFTTDEDVIAAAYLHDTVEDTNITFVGIRNDFGLVVANLVEQVTDVSRQEDGNRAARKYKDLIHLMQADDYGKLIKLADLYDNTKTIVQYDKTFAKVYLAEKETLLQVLRPFGEISVTQRLYDQVVAQVKQAKLQLAKDD